MTVDQHICMLARHVAIRPLSSLLCVSLSLNTQGIPEAGQSLHDGLEVLELLVMGASPPKPSEPLYRGYMLLVKVG